MADPLPTLGRVELERVEFHAPVKLINDGHDLSHFLTSEAYRDITLWILQLNRSMFPRKTTDGKIQLNNLDTPLHLSTNIQQIQDLIGDFALLIEQAPPDAGPRRFGNVAFRKWFELAESQVDGVLCQRVGVLQSSTTLIQELRTYLLESFGSAQRLDYGTGHELSFIAFLGCLWKIGFFHDGEEQAIVLALIQPYLELIRKLILTYTLEPAGSHGVWGLDDHSFIPYVFGSAQLGPTIPQGDVSRPAPTEGSLPDAPVPSSVTDKAAVTELRNSNLYFSAIQFIYDVKKGPFWEHSPILYDIAGIPDGWGKINKGMLKMYSAEVLAKFPVVQHFKFGSLFRWTSDPNAVSVTPSIHAQQQRAVPQGTKVPPVAANAGTATAWATPRDGVKTGASAQTGIPSTRAPWASATQAARSNKDLPSKPRA